MIQIIGSALVLASGTALGFAAARRYRARPRELQLLMSALQMLATEIDYTATPLPQALRTVAERLSAPIDQLFVATSDLLSAATGRTAGQCWQEALESTGGQTALRKQDMDILRRFGHTLGVSDRTDQLLHIRLACEQLENARRLAQDEQGRNERLCQYLGVLAGLMIVILMV